MSLAELAAAYAEQVRASQAQRASRRGQQGDRWTERSAHFRADPRRAPGPYEQGIASYVEPSDTVLDIGGGAGRYSLPLALRCKEVINVEPSAGMREQFEAAARDAGIANVRTVASGWPAEGIEGDVALNTHVTYFGEDIVPFIEKVHRAVRRRAIIDIHSVPPPNRTIPHYKLVRGSELGPVPAHRELLPHPLADGSPA